MTIANLITLIRLFLVPIVILLFLEGYTLLTFLLFAFAAISDALDGMIARKFDQVTKLGTFLDPIADKLLISSLAIVLGFTNVLPYWIVVIIVSRDLLIVLAVVVSFLAAEPMSIRPIALSKINTAVALALIGFCLWVPAFAIDKTGGPLEATFSILIFSSAITNLGSLALYFGQWFKSFQNK